MKCSSNRCDVFNRLSDNLDHADTAYRGHNAGYANFQLISTETGSPAA